MLKKWICLLIVIFFAFEGVSSADSMTQQVLRKLREDCKQLLLETYKHENSFVRAAVLRAAG